MKAFIAGVITLSILISLVVVNAFLIVKKTDRLIDMIEALPSDPAIADADAISSEWERSRTWIALTVHRENVDDIDDTLAQMISSLKSGDPDGYVRSRTDLLSLTMRLKKTETFSISRIF